MVREIGVGGFVVSTLARRYVNEVLDSSRLSYGPFHRRFEAAFAAEHDSKHSVFCNSGTSALQIALQALRRSTVGPTATRLSSVGHLHRHFEHRPTQSHGPGVRRCGSLTYTLDPAKFEAAITPKTRAVIPVHLLGLPADMDPIITVARERGLSIIEDSAETMFARYKGRKVGSLGDIGCFSTYIAHYIVTGVGGFATTSDPDLQVRLRSLMNHGRDSIYLSIDDDAGATGEKLHEIVAKRFQFVSVGHSYRATELEAALGLAQLEEKDGIVAARIATAKRLSAGLREFEDKLQLPFSPPDRDHTFMLYGLVLKNADKVQLVNFLEDRGVETRDMLPLLNQPVYRKMFGNLEPKFPVARSLNRSAFYIGCHQHMTLDDTDYVIEQFQAFFKKRPH